MASRFAGVMVYREDDYSFQMASRICMYIYKSVWTPFIEETLSLNPDDGNELDIYAVSLVKDGAIVDHAPIVFFRLFIFLGTMDTITAKVTGSTRIITCAYKRDAPNSDH